MLRFRHFIVTAILVTTFSSSISRADDTLWKQKALQATVLVGGIGCALGGYTLVGAGLILSSALSFGVSYLRNSCPQREGPGLEDALKTLNEQVPLDTPDEMIQYFYNAFRDSTAFAVADAGSFRGNIAEGQEEVVLAKANKEIHNAKAINAKNKNQTLPGSLLIEKDSERRNKILKTISDNVVISETGICTTFAALAYTLLTKNGQAKNVPVEIISRRETGGRAQASTHLFTVVGRNPESDLNDPTTWGADARIVDLWLGALGNAFVYKPDSADYQGWLKNLKVVHSNLQ